MSVNSINAVQELLQGITSGAVKTDNTEGAFANILSEAIFKSEEGSEKPDANMFSELLEGSSSSALLSCLLSSGCSSLMMQSLFNAISGGTDSILPAMSSGFTTASGTGVIPAEPWKPAQPGITSNAYNRSANLYNAVIGQFSVETNERYQPDGGTYCNIFVWDVTTAMGAEIPHYYDADTGKPMSYGDKGASQMNANGMYKWLHEYGDQYGWYEVTPGEAQELANEGHPVVTALYRDGAHGHVQMVCPSRDGEYDAERGVTIAQAGRRLTSYRPITEIYNASLSRVSYFAHM